MRSKMSLKTPNKDFQKKSFLSLFRKHYSKSSFYDMIENVRIIHNHLMEGKPVCIEWFSGARKGSVGYLDISPGQFESWKNVYDPLESYYFDYSCKIPFIMVKFHDSTKTIKLPIQDTQTSLLKCLIRDDLAISDTKFVFTKKEKEVIERPILYDQFETPLKVGQTIITNHGMRNTYYTVLAKITRITDSGTIFIKTIPTPGYPVSKEERYGIFPNNCMVIDEEFMNKILLTQLSK